MQILLQSKKRHRKAISTLLSKNIQSDIDISAFMSVRLQCYVINSVLIELNIVARQLEGNINRKNEKINTELWRILQIL